MKGRMTAKLWAALVIVGIVAGLVACGGTPATDGTERPAGAVLLEERCVACHSLDGVRSAQKSRDAWDATVTRMVGMGAQLTAEEQTTLVDYLAATYGP